MAAKYPSDSPVQDLTGTRRGSSGSLQSLLDSIKRDLKDAARI